MAGTQIAFQQKITCTVSEACEAIGIGRTKLYELIGCGKLHSTTIGRRRLIVVNSLLTLIPSPQPPAAIDLKTRARSYRARA